MKQANATQRQWMSDISKWSFDNLVTLYPGYDDSDFQLHHVLGRSAKHNKVAIGHEFVIPVPIELHDISSNHPLNVTHHKHKFTSAYGDQRGIFQVMYSAMEYQGYDVPSMEIYETIMSTNA